MIIFTDNNIYNSFYGNNMMNIKLNKTVSDKPSKNETSIKTLIIRSGKRTLK